jgi:hypothetical protein
MTFLLQEYSAILLVLDTLSTYNFFSALLTETALTESMTEHTSTSANTGTKFKMLVKCREQSLPNMPEPDTFTLAPRPIKQVLIQHSVLCILLSIF